MKTLRYERSSCKAFLSDKAEYPLYLQGHDLAIGPFRLALVLPLFPSVVLLFLYLPARAFTMLSKLTFSFLLVSFCKI